MRIESLPQSSVDLISLLVLRSAVTKSARRREVPAARTVGRGARSGVPLQLLEVGMAAIIAIGSRVAAAHPHPRCLNRSSSVPGLQRRRRAAAGVVQRPRAASPRRRTALQPRAAVHFAAGIADQHRPCMAIGVGQPLHFRSAGRVGGCGCALWSGPFCLSTSDPAAAAATAGMTAASSASSAATSSRARDTFIAGEGKERTAAHSRMTAVRRGTSRRRRAAVPVSPGVQPDAAMGDQQPRPRPPPPPRRPAISVEHGTTTPTGEG